MAKGRKPKPSWMKVIDGNPGKRDIPEAEPEPFRPAKAPRAPSHLDKMAQAEWRRVVPELMRLGLFTVVDGAMLEAYCASYSTWRKACDTLEELGDVYESVGKNGNRMWRARPEVAIANEALRQMRAFASEFGLSPVARVRLQGHAQADLFGQQGQEGGQAAGWGGFR